MRKPLLVRVGVGHLSDAARSVFESFLALIDSGGVQFVPTLDAALIEFFDRAETLDRHSSQTASAARIYLRGYEPAANAPAADAVLDRPIRPTALAAVLRHYSTGRETAVASDTMMEVDGDGLLHWIHHHRIDEWTSIEADDGRQWYCHPARRRVSGDSIRGATPTTRFRISRAHAHGQATGDTQFFQDWVWSVARCSGGLRLIDHDDSSPLLLERAPTFSSETRRFARLVGAFLRPNTVTGAAATMRVPVSEVRSFLNGAILLHWIRCSGSPVQSKAPQKAPDQGIFSRLLRRLTEATHHDD